MASNRFKGLEEAGAAQRSALMGQLLKVDEEIEVLEEEYGAPVEAYAESPDLELMKVLALQARDQMAAPPHSNIAAQLAMIRNPAFGKQWHDTTRGRVNAAREYFQRQGLIARQGASEKESWRRAAKKDPTRLLAARKRRASLQSAITGSSQMEATKKLDADTRLAVGGMQTRSREAIAATREQGEPVDIGKRLREVDKDISNIARISKLTTAESQAQLMAAVNMVVPPGFARSTEVRQAALLALKEKLREARREKRILQAMKKKLGMNFVPQEEYNKTEAWVRKRLGEPKTQSAAPTAVVPAPGPKAEIRAKFR